MRTLFPRLALSLTLLVDVAVGLAQQLPSPPATAPAASAPTASYDFSVRHYGGHTLRPDCTLYHGIACRQTGGGADAHLYLKNEQLPPGIKLDWPEIRLKDATGIYNYGTTDNVVAALHADKTAGAGNYTVKVTLTGYDRRTNPPTPVSHDILIPLTVEAPSPPLKPVIPHAQPPIPMLEVWEKHMLTGAKFYEKPEVDRVMTWEGGGWYYDGARVCFQIGDYTKDPVWYARAQNVLSMYRDKYVLAGGVQGWRVFPHGMAMDYVRNGQPAADKAGVIKLATESAYALPTTPLGRLAHPSLSRETAFLLNACLQADVVGDHTQRDRVETYKSLCIGHLEQWTTKRFAYTQPFMFGLTAEALIGAHDKTGDPQIVTALQKACDWFWDNAWIEKDTSFWYQSYPLQNDDSINTPVPDPLVYPAKGSPDLNLLICPAYQWIYKQTGDPKYRDRADNIFAGGVKGAFLDQGKHFSQNYRWSFKYVEWRK